MNSEKQIELFFGQATGAEARIYAQFSADQPGDLELVGEARGPLSDLARTLPAKIAFRNLGPGKTLLAEALLPDPCLWLPGEPYYYQVQAEVIDTRQSDVPLAAVDQMFAIRPLATAGRDLLLASRRWVLRGVHCQPAPSPEELALWREAGAALVIDNPDGQLCHAASRAGVLVVARLNNFTRLSQLARWPAVGMAIFPAGVADEIPLAARPKNLILGQHFPPGTTVQPADWANVVLVEDSDPTSLHARTAELTLPVLAYRPAPPAEIAAARPACDTLQRELAPLLQCAGYVV